MSLDSIKQRIGKVNARRQSLTYYPYFKSSDPLPAGRILVDGKSLLNMSSNDYLGLSFDKRVIEASQKATDKYGTSRCGSRLLNGTAKIHEEAEETLSAFFGKERTLLFSSGHQANLGLFQSLLGRGDTLLLDKDCHASIYDGVALSGTSTERFIHNDFYDAKSRFTRLDGAPAILATEGIFSMDGSIPDLGELVRLFGEVECLKVVDEAHSIGVLGSGKGAAAEFGVLSETDILSGAFSKSLASVGGFISASSEIIKYIRDSARSLIFTAAPAPSAVAAAMKALEILSSEPERITSLRGKIGWFKAELGKIGVSAGNPVSPIIPLRIASPEMAFRACMSLMSKGFMLYPIIPPASPQGICMIRISITESHTTGELTRFIEAIDELKISESLLETA